MAREIRRESSGSRGRRAVLGGMSIAAMTAIAVACFGADVVAAARGTERVSVGPGGEGNGAAGGPAVSADGRVVAFTSLSSNLVAGDANGAQDIFVRDRITGRTELISVSSNGMPGDSFSDEPAISADGRFVAFTSAARNLVGGDTNIEKDVFVRDRLLGTTELISTSTGGTLGDSGSSSPAIAADGRVVAFESTASKLVPGDTNGNLDVFVRDRRGQVATTRRASIASGGAEGDRESFDPTISADGRLLAFASAATTLTQFDTNRKNDIFVRDLQASTTARVSVRTGGAQGDGAAFQPRISANGRFVAFSSFATNLVPGDSNAEGMPSSVTAKRPRRYA